MLTAREGGRWRRGEREGAGGRGRREKSRGRRGKGWLEGEEEGEQRRF